MGDKVLERPNVPPPPPLPCELLEGFLNGDRTGMVQLPKFGPVNFQIQWLMPPGMACLSGESYPLQANLSATRPRNLALARRVTMSSSKKQGPMTEQMAFAPFGCFTFRGLYGVEGIGCGAWSP